MPRGGPCGAIDGGLISTCPRHGSCGVGICCANTCGVRLTATDECAACGGRVLSAGLHGLRHGLELLFALVKLILCRQRTHLLLQGGEGHERTGEEAFHLTYVFGTLLLVEGHRELAQIRQEVLDVAKDFFLKLALERKSNRKKGESQIVGCNSLADGAPGNIGNLPG